LESHSRTEGAGLANLVKENPKLIGKTRPYQTCLVHCKRIANSPEKAMGYNPKGSHEADFTFQGGLSRLSAAK
jgi:hypothetical protein